MAGPYFTGPPEFSITPPYTAFGTVVTALIPPCRGPEGGAPFLYKVDSNFPNWIQNLSTHITSMPFLSGSDQQTVYVMRPLNWTYFPKGLAKNLTAIPNGSGVSSTGLYSDPGIYSTNFNYPLPGLQPWGPTLASTGVAQVADAAISSTNKYVAYQLADGTWQLDTITSGTFNATLTLTTGTPNRANGNIIAGAPLFYFGAITLSVPQTGQPHLLFQPKTSTTDDILGPVTASKGITSLNPGDPIMVYDTNATSTASFKGIFGDYRRMAG